MFLSIKPIPNGNSSAGTTMSCLSRCSLRRVIAVHSPETHLHSISSNAIWMAEAACWLQTYSSLCTCWIALFFCGMCFISTQTSQTGGEVIAFAVTLCSQRDRERHIFFTLWVKTLQKIFALCVCESQFNRVLLTLFSCYSWICPPTYPTRTSSNSVAWLVRFTNRATELNEWENSL